MSATPVSDDQPGWSLDQPFDLHATLTDLHHVIGAAAELSRADDGSPETAEARRTTARIARLLAARIDRHAQEWER